MTVIKLDAATLAKFQAAEGQVVLADEAGKPIRLCVLPPVPTSEPELSPEEWKRRMDPKGGMTTAQMLEYLRGLGNP
jgi:hypothetical protein